MNYIYRVEIYYRNRNPSLHTPHGANTGFFFFSDELSAEAWADKEKTEPTKSGEELQTIRIDKIDIECASLIFWAEADQCKYNRTKKSETSRARREEDKIKIVGLMNRWAFHSPNNERY